MKNMLMRFLKDEEGQDLIEYTLLMAFIALASAAIFVNAGAASTRSGRMRATSFRMPPYRRQLNLIRLDRRGRGTAAFRNAAGPAVPDLRNLPDPGMAG